MHLMKLCLSTGMMGPYNMLHVVDMAYYFCNFCCIHYHTITLSYGTKLRCVCWPFCTTYTFCSNVLSESLHPRQRILSLVNTYCIQ